MIISILDLIVLISTLVIYVTIYLLDNKLPKVLEIRDKSQIPVFSISKTKFYYLIFGIGIYVWLIEFLILNDAVLLRLYSTILAQLNLFFLLIISNLGYRKLGNFFGIASMILFVLSVFYYI
ncbi:hypothetical protein [Orenia marismortui]|uniref:hypothetical protein n=1 Tax=Orenia marismortui TaxID=46469 RepID=UPI00036DFD1E|nr:hypothetical protein [Orenia marismortui]